jgi:hypothetical protein
MQPGVQNANSNEVTTGVRTLFVENSAYYSRDAPPFPGLKRATAEAIPES